jgi:circadian clock protein KaiC
MVDGVIELGEQLVGSRAVRHVQLRKTRGSGALSGRHECLIDEADARLSAPGSVVQPPQPVGQRIQPASSGVEP